MKISGTLLSLETARNCRKYLLGALLVALAPASFAAADGVPLVTYESMPTELQLTEACPRIEVFADGSVVANYPTVMKKAGQWEGRLSAAQLLQLNALLSAPEMVAEELSALKAQAVAVRQLRREAGEVFEVSDGSVSRFIFATTEGEKVMEWRALRSDARQLGLPALGSMAALENMLMGFADRLQRSDSAEDVQ